MTREQGQFEKHEIAANGFCGVYTRRYRKRWVVHPSKSTMLACKKRLRQRWQCLLVWILSLDNLMIFWGGVASGCLRSFPPWPAQSLPFLVKLMGSNIKHLIMSKIHDAQIWCTFNLQYISIMAQFISKSPQNICHVLGPEDTFQSNKNTNGKFTSSCWSFLKSKFWTSIEQTSLKKVNSSNKVIEVQSSCLTQKDCHIHMITYQTYITVLQFSSILWECIAYTHILSHSNKFSFSSHQCLILLQGSFEKFLCLEGDAYCSQASKQVWLEGNVRPILMCFRISGSRMLWGKWYATPLLGDTRRW